MQEQSGYIIGFSGTYYCLWSWITQTNYSMSGNGSYVATGGYTKYHYIKRISTDIDKVKKLYPTLSIDMGLHGKTWVFTDNNFKNQVAFAYDVFPKGYKGVGTKIMESSESKHLWSLYLSSECGIGRSKVYARKRLVELGLLVPYKTFKNVNIMKYDYDLCREISTGEIITIRKSYCTPELVAKLELQKNMIKGHFLENGSRVKLMLKQVSSFSFDTQFGTCFVVEYKDAENRVFKYKGNKPPYFENKDCFTTINATIKHSNYKGQDETLIQRISFK